MRLPLTASLATVGLLIGLPLQGEATPTLQNFDTPGTPFTLTGAPGSPPAQIRGGGPTGNFIRLVTIEPGSANELAFQRTHIGPADTIVADFDFRLIEESPGVRADGFGFALLDTSIFGMSGPGPLNSEFFPAEEPNVAGSFGLGFDIWENFETNDPINEPNNNHLSVHFDGETLSVFDPGFDLANGVFNHAHLEIDLGDAGAIVSLVLTPNAFGTPGPILTPISDFFVPGMTPYESRVALGARTGAVFSDEDFDNFNVQFSPQVPVPEPPSILVIGLGLLGILFCRGWRQTAARQA